MQENLLKEIRNSKVEWKEIGELASLYNGLTGKNKANFEKGNAKYISYKNIFSNIEINFQELEKVEISPNERQNEVKYGDILFTNSSETASELGFSSAITEKVEEKIYLNSFSFGLRFHEDKLLLPEFAKYLFRCDFMRKAIQKTGNGVTRINLSKEKFKKIKIPLPSLELQNKIVEILDKFSKATSKLQKELKKENELRKKQYEFYREKLLSFGDEVEWKELGEVGEIIRGNGLTKKDFTEFGIPAIHYGQIYTFYGTSTKETKSFVSEETAKKLKKVNFGDVIITNTSENLQDVGKALLYLGEKEAVTGGHATIFKASKEILGKYFVYLSQSLDFIKQKNKFAKGIKVIDVSANEFSKILIPIPPIEKQKEIIEILDKFETLTNSISEGLPKEIELRQKQYEYYRNLLLSFKE